MKITPACRQCLERLVDQASKLATGNPRLQAEARTKALKVLSKRISPHTVSTVVASEAHRVIRDITSNPDPYAGMKKREIDLARVSAAAICNANADLESCIHIAVRGNAIDFFIDSETIAKDLTKPISLAINNIAQVKMLVGKARRIIYLADNAGECYFDLPLVDNLHASAETIYVVKGFPVQNDITLKDLEAAGLKDSMGKVVTTGNDFVGLDLATSSAEFRRKYGSADLIIAKGMGYYETITEMKGEGRVVFLLKAKCQPVADSLGVPLGSCVVNVY